MHLRFVLHLQWFGLLRLQKFERKFHYYLEYWFISDGEILYENEFIEELYSMLSSYFISFVDLNDDKDYRVHFKSLLFVLDNNLTDVEHVAAAMCYDDLSL